MADFLLPFNFTPTSGEKTIGKNFVPHDQFSGKRGSIKVVMKTLTATFIPDPERSWKELPIVHKFQNRFNDGDRVIFRERKTDGVYFADKLISAQASVEDFLAEGREYLGEAWLCWQKNGGEMPEQLREYNDDEILKNLMKKRFVGKVHGNKIRAKAVGNLQGHGIMDFFRLGETPAIPSTSLKGMYGHALRKLTNACFAHVGWKHYTKRLLPKEQLEVKTGVAVQVAEKWYIIPASEVLMRRNDFPIGTWVDFQHRPKSNRPEGVHVRIANITGKGNQGKIMPYLVGIDLSEQKRDKKGYTARIITNKIIKEDRDQYIHSGTTVSSESLLARCLNGEEFTEQEMAQAFRNSEIDKIPLDVLRRYNAYRQTAFEEERDRYQRIERLRLCSGDFVYYTMEDDQVTSFGKNYRFKRHARHEMREYFGNHTEKCETISCLCPACRVFGLVNKQQAVAGRVAFGFGRFGSWDKEQGFIISDQQSILPENANRETIKVLGPPRASFSGFYLMPVENWNKYPTDDDTPGNVKGRGRKGYWHHPALTPQCYRDNRGPGEGIKKDHQNASIELCPEGNYFSFTVDFVNLEEHELGLLLYLLSFGLPEGPEAELAHKLGRGRPLGLGSISTVQLELELENDDRYFDLSAPVSKSKSNWGNYVQKFKNWIETMTNNQAKFDDLGHIKAFRKMARFRSQTREGSSICYPRQGEIYRWYMDHKNEGGILPLATNAEKNLLKGWR